ERQMKFSKWIEFVAFRIAASIAGKTSSPLMSSRAALPSTNGVPSASPIACANAGSFTAGHDGVFRARVCAPIAVATSRANDVNPPRARERFDLIRARRLQQQREN